MKKNDSGYINKFMNDKKFKAKIELTLGFSLIFILLIYASISGVSSNYNYNNSSNTITTSKEYESSNEETLLDKISNNYQYDCNINLSKYKTKEEKELDNYIINYKGTVSNNKEIINKSINDTNTSYYKENNKYYLKDNNEESSIDIIYDLVNYKYIDINTIKNYINIGKLDHTTNYSNGNITYVYNVLISDIINTYKGTNSFDIEVNIIGNEMTISIDYTSLIKESDDLVKELKINIKYSNINEIEDININN